MNDRRRPLEQHGGPIHATGPDDARSLLVRALEAAANAEPDTLTHGFHTWTARMHPAIASVAIDALTRPSSTVLDPFSGSGTVAVEAFVAGRASVASDLNPLAALLGRVKCQRRDAESLHRLDDKMREVAQKSEERVRARIASVAPIPKSVALWFEGHVLKELAGLREEILACEDAMDRDAMRIVFSSILVKVSKKRADSSHSEAMKTLRKGLVTEFFERKGRELVERQAALAEHLPKGAKAPRFLNADARALPRLLAPETTFDLVVSSPPYGGTYDYADHHELRYAFLGLDPTKLTEDEIGARRFSREFGALRRWDEQTHAFLEAMRARLTPEGNVLLVVGDGRVEGEHIPVIDQLTHIAPHAGLEVHATASESRAGFGFEDGPPRAEHIVWLKPTRSVARPSRGSDERGSAATRPRESSPRDRSRPRRRA